MDEALRELARRRDVSPDDGMLEIREILAAARGDPTFIPSLYQRLAHALDVEYRRRPLDIVVPVDPDVPLSHIQVILNGMVFPVMFSTDAIEFEFLPDGKHARIRGRAFNFADLDELEVASFGPLGGQRRIFMIEDPRSARYEAAHRSAARASGVRRVCNDCDEALDQHGDCLCTVGLYDPKCPECAGSCINYWTIHFEVPDPCSYCDGEGTLAAYAHRANEELRD